MNLLFFLLQGLFFALFGALLLVASIFLFDDSFIEV